MTTDDAHGPAGYGARRLRRCAQAERVLRACIEQSGVQVDGDMLAAAWDATGQESPGAHAAAGRWGEVLAPAIHAGRVIVTRRGRQPFYRPADLPVPLPPAPSRPRLFSAELVALAEQGEEVVRQVAMHTGCAVPTGDLVDAWEGVHGKPFPARMRKRVQRLLLPALQRGSVLAQRVGPRMVFRPAAQPSLRLPHYLSDAERTEEALRRACRAFDSAVTCDDVKAQVDADPELTFRGRTPVCTVLGLLKRRGTIKSVRVHRRGVRTPQYYTVEGGPQEVRAPARTMLDARLDVIRGYWTATGGLPFSTHRIQRFARRQDPARFRDDPVWAWTGALHHLCKTGYLIKFRRSRRRYALWALRASWEALSEAERERRLVDLLRQPKGSPLHTSRHLARHLRYDPHGISRNQDMRALLRFARAAVVELAETPEDAEVAARRPLCVRDIGMRVPKDHPLRPVAPLAVALEEAARIRATMVTPELVLIGGVREEAWYDTEWTPDAAAFAAYLRTLDALDLRQLERAIDALQERLTTRSGPIRVPLEGLGAQWRAAHDAVEQFREQLQAALRDAPLNRADVTQVTDLLRRLASAARHLDALRRPLGAHVKAAGADASVDAEALSYEAAWAELAPLTGFTMKTPRELPARLPRVPRLTEPPSRRPRRTGRGRPAVRAFDRIGYALYASERWGGPVLRYMASLAADALGSTRTPDSVLTALCHAPPETHPAAASALAFFDVHATRVALLDYIQRSISRNSEGVRRQSLVAAELGTWGLAPLPFGRSTHHLAAPERDTLLQVRDHAGDERLRLAAGAVLDFWQGRPLAELAYAFYGPPPLGVVRWPPVPALEADVLLEERSSGR